MTEPKEGDRITIKDGFEFVCPFCGKNAATSKEPPVVLHEMPPCETYLKYDIIEYLRRVNRHNATSQGLVS